MTLFHWSYFMVNFILSVIRFFSPPPVPQKHRQVYQVGLQQIRLQMGWAFYFVVVDFIISCYFIHWNIVLSFILLSIGHQPMNSPSKSPSELPTSNPTISPSNRVRNLISANFTLLSSCNTLSSTYLHIVAHSWPLKRPIRIPNEISFEITFTGGKTAIMMLKATTVSL